MVYSNIYTITGLPGSGKTTIGIKLSKKLKYHFIDLDEYLEKKYSKSITDIFTLLGENTFRKYESIALQEILSSVEPNYCLVLSLGGGTVCFGNNLSLCLQNTILIWLNTSFDLIYKRLINCNVNNRPILNSNNLLTQLQNMYTTRQPFYSQSHLKINITDNNLNKTINDILDNINI